MRYRWWLAAVLGGFVFSGCGVRPVVDGRKLALEEPRRAIDDSLVASGDAVYARASATASDDEPDRAGEPPRDGIGDRKAADREPSPGLIETIERVGSHFKKDHAVRGWRGAFEPDDWALYGVMTAATLGVRQADNRLRNNFDDVDPTLGDAAQLDDYVVVGMPLVATAMMYYDPARTPAGRGDDLAAWSETLALSAATAFSLKELTGRSRPANGPDNDSFPSAHTMIATSAAAFVDDLYREKYGWKVSVPVWASVAFVGYARMDRDRHWASDVVGGLALGYLIENIVYEWHYGDGGVTPRRFTVMPMTDGETVGVVGVLRF